MHDDGDEEDLEAAEVDVALALYETTSVGGMVFEGEANVEVEGAGVEVEVTVVEEGEAVTDEVEVEVIKAVSRSSAVPDDGQRVHGLRVLA